jgi:hypothetical protein
MTWTLDASEDGIVCLAFEEISSKDKFYDPLSIEVKGFARVRVPYGLYRDARIDKTFYFPPAFFYCESKKAVSEIYVTPGEIRNLRFCMAESGRFTLEYKYDDKAMIANPVSEVSPHWLAPDPLFMLRGTNLFDRLEIAATHEETGQVVRCVAETVNDATEQPLYRRKRLLAAAKNARSDKAFLDLFGCAKKLVKEKLPANVDPEKDWQSEQSDPGLTLQQFVAAHAEARVFLIGESHKNPEDLESLWSILAALEQANRVTLLLEQIPSYDLRLAIGAAKNDPASGMLDFTTGLRELNAGNITPAQFQCWTQWSSYWTNPAEDDKLRELVSRAVKAKMIVSGLDLQKDGELQTGDLHRDPFMTLFLQAAAAAAAAPRRTLVTLNGRAHLLGKDAVQLLGISRFLRKQGVACVTLRPVAGAGETRFYKHKDRDDYRYTVPNYAG